MSSTAFTTYHVTPEVPRRTLSTALRFWLKDESWSKLRKKITGRFIQVNGNLCVDEARPLNLQDVVRVWQHPLAKPPSHDDVQILHLDDHLVVVEKPSGMTTLRHSEESHWPQHRRDRQPTLDEVLPRVLMARHRQNNPRQGQPPSRHRTHSNPGRVRAVHRLDRETSGVMVFARTIPVERSLVQMFREHALHRAYLALVKGSIASCTIRDRLIRDRGDGRRGVTAEANEGQDAITHVRHIETIGEFSLVECRLETGRTHQIRIHLASRGHLVCGEKVYDKPHGKPRILDSSGAPRLALHAAELGFEHPVTHKPLQFRSEFPDDLQQFLDRLRSNRG